jgi:hypothetical protein
MNHPSPLLPTQRSFSTEAKMTDHQTVSIVIYLLSGTVAGAGLFTIASQNDRHPIPAGIAAIIGAIVGLVAFSILGHVVPFTVARIIALAAIGLSCFIAFAK